MPGEDGGALLRTLSQPSIFPERGMGFQEVELPGEGAHRQAGFSTSARDPNHCPVGPSHTQNAGESPGVPGNQVLTNPLGRAG